MDGLWLGEAGVDAIERPRITSAGWVGEDESAQPDQSPTIPPDVREAYAHVHYLYAETVRLYIGEQLYSASADGIRIDDHVMENIERLHERAFRLFLGDLLRRTGLRDYLYVLLCCAQTVVNEQLRGHFESARPAEWIENFRAPRPL